MSIRRYMSGSENVMFVSDLLKTAQSEAALVQPPPRSGSIYERVREEQRRLENERYAVRDKKRQLEELQATLQEPRKRHQIHQHKNISQACQVLREEIEAIESGSVIEEFNSRVRPYIHEFQRQQFCRPHESSPHSTLVSSPEQSQAVVNEYIVNIEKGVPLYDIQSQDLCPDCRDPMQLYQAYSLLICSKCGQSKPFLDATASLLAYSDDYDYCSFSYKRINHFSEWLASIQAKETLEVPQTVLDTIMQQLHDQRVHSNEDVTVHKIREILKKLKLRKYYEHVQLITCKITARAPPRMTPEMEEKIKVCFLAASSAFQRHCPPDRKNMISYQLVLLKLCELLGYHAFVPYFLLLKGKDKLSRMDSIWKKICEDLDWTYIPSVP